MKHANIIITIAGLAFIGVLAWFVSPWFTDIKVLVLDAVVVAVAFLTFVYATDNIFMRSKDFSRSMASTGVNIYVSSAYILLSLAGVVVGLWLQDYFKWQVLYQALFAAVLFFGLAVGKFSDKRMDEVAAASAAGAASRDTLKDLGGRLEVEAGLSATLCDDTKKRIRRLVERIAYITPSDSPAAALLEDKLAAALNNLAADVARGATDDEMEQTLTNAENVVSQRIRTT